MMVTMDSADTSLIRAGYDRWALVYDHDANPLPALEEPFVHETIGPVAGLAVLDLGCGTGRHALWLAAAGARVTAVDFSEGMLAEARRKPGAEAVRFVMHDLHERLPFPSGSFDRIVSGLVLEHIRDLHGFFREARRMLEPGGRAVVSAMHPAMFLRGSQARFTDPGIRPGRPAGQPAAPIRRHRHGDGPGRVPDRSDRRARPRRGLRLTLSAGREVSRVADACGAGARR